MSTQNALRRLLLAAFLSNYALSAHGQPPPMLHDYVKHCLEKEQVDSALAFLETTSTQARAANNLNLWAWAGWEKQRAAPVDSQKVALLKNLLNTAWRAPQNPQEQEPFLWIYATIGWYTFEAQVWESLQNYEAARAIYESNRYQGFESVEIIYKPLSALYISLGDNDKAIAILQKALAIGGDNETVSGIYANIGIAYWNKGEYATAEENYNKGLSFKDISNGKKGLLLGRLAETLLDLGRIAEAASTASKAILLLKPDGPDDSSAFEYRARAQRIAGMANTLLGKFADARRLLAGALSDDLTANGKHTREVGKDYIALSKLCLRQGQTLPAIDAANRALAAVLPQYQAPAPQLPNPNPQVGQYYEENTIFEALSAKAAAARQHFENTGDLRWLELALECHEHAWQAEALLRRVFQYSSSKLNLQKDARAREEAAMNVARLLFEKTGQTVWLEKAFAIAERSKATLLLEALQDNLVRQRLSDKDPRFGELTALRQSLSYFDKNLLLEPQSEKAASWRIEADGIRGRIAALEQTLHKAYPNLAGFDAGKANWVPNAADFAASEAMLEYFMSEHWLDIFVFQPNRPAVWRRIPNDTALQSLLARYLAFFQNDFAILNDPAAYFQTAFALWQKIVPPEAATAQELTILPDGILNFVPFEALLTQLDGTPSLRNAAYLVRQQEVRYAWSLAVLRQQKNLRSRAPNYLLSIAPGFANRERGLAPLASAPFDWSGIQGWNMIHLSGKDADLQHFLKASGGYRVLHFSTHAFASGNPRIELMDSSLLLPDLYALPLEADLVMLSACETGLGKEARGEGVMSLARAFAQAGAACIVSSLWSVNDQSTSRLLRYFYGNIQRGHGSGTALREAKLAYLSDAEVGSAAQSPYFWAGLVAVGDNRAIPQPWGWGAWAGTALGLIALLFAAIWLRRRREKGGLTL